MIIYPAIDLRDGKCVRLYKGDFATTKVYEETPSNMLAEFARHGATWMHMVDLDGAKAGRVAQIEIIADLVKKSGLNIEVGGGIRTTEDVDKLFRAGVKRIVVGSLCVSNPDLVNDWFRRFGADSIVLALDCSLDADNIPRIRTHGWQEESKLSIYDVLDNYPLAKHVLCTDIAVDGTLEGASLALYAQMLKKLPQLEIIASGGVGSIEDIYKLNELGVHGVVVGKAIYEGKIDLAELLNFNNKT